MHTLYLCSDFWVVPLNSKIKNYGSTIPTLLKLKPWDTAIYWQHSSVHSSVPQYSSIGLPHACCNMSEKRLYRWHEFSAYTPRYVKGSRFLYKKSTFRYCINCVQKLDKVVCCHKVLHACVLARLEHVLLITASWNRTKEATTESKVLFRTG